MSAIVPSKPGFTESDAKQVLRDNWKIVRQIIEAAKPPAPPRPVQPAQSPKPPQR